MSTAGPLNTTGVDFSNETQAADFLAALLDDSELSVTANTFSTYFWFGVVALVGVVAVYNVALDMQLKASLRAASKNQPITPANAIKKAVLTITAFSHWATYPQYTPARLGRYFTVPPVGTVILLLVYFFFIVILEFTNNDIEGAQFYSGIAIRAGWLGTAQIPLLLILAGKNNLIGFVTSISYERLNILHRWVARMLLLLVTVHLAYFSFAFNKYDIRSLEWATDSCIPTGFASYALLLWMNISTLAPIRNFSYEFFVVQHILTSIGFIIAVMTHLLGANYYAIIYVVIGIVLYGLDRLIRTGRYAYNNLCPGRATLTPLEGGVTRIHVQAMQIKKWKPGSHVFLSIPRLGVGQSHPATIASIPTADNDELVFILKAHKGFTRRLLSTPLSLLSRRSRANADREALLPDKREFVALIDGPYGGSLDFAAFEKVLLVSASTGVTFTLPLLLDIASRASLQKLPIRRLEFVWVVKKMSWTSWISEELHEALHELRRARIVVTINIFVTCSDSPDDTTSIKSGRVHEEGDNEMVDSRSTTSKKNATDFASEKDTHDFMSCVTFKAGRPSLSPILQSLVKSTDGRTGVGVCGPAGLTADVRNSVATVSKETAGSEDITLHAECFGW